MLTRTPKAAGPPLFILAFDHRRSLVTGMLDGDERRAAEVLPGAKRLIWEAVLAAEGHAARAGGRAGVLVDDRYGAEVVRAAKAAGVVTAVAIEVSGRDELALEHGDDTAAYLEAQQPDFAKVLVRYNPGGDAEANARQRATLAAASAAVAALGIDLLVELLVPPTAADLRDVGGDRDRYDVERRADLAVRAIADFRAAGVEASMWKLEAFEREEDAAAVAAQAAAPCLVLGRNAPQARIEHWLAVAAATAGWAGFAVGRSIWWDAVAGWLYGALPPEEAIGRISAGYTRAVDVYADSLARSRSPLP